MWFNNIFGNIPLPSDLNSKKLARFENDLEFQNCFIFLLTNLLDVFEWDLPETCNERFLELSLIYRGQALFANEEGSLINLVASNSGDFNVYGEPLHCYGFGVNGWNKEYNMFVPGASETRPEDTDKLLRKSVTGRIIPDDYNAVLCRDNSLSYPYMSYLVIAAERMAKVMRSIDVATTNLKQPVLITCEESYKSSVEKVLDDTYSNRPYVIAIKGFNTKFANFDTIDLKPDPSVLDAMWRSYDKLDATIKQIIGIDCITNIDKKAQMLSGELSGNNMALEYSLSKRLSYRKKACEHLYDAFGIYADVRLKHEVEQDAYIPQDSETEVQPDEL